MREIKKKKINKLKKINKFLKLYIIKFLKVT